MDAFTVRLFPLFAVIVAAAAYFFPKPLAQGAGWIAPLLGLVMLGMGLTLELEDFRRCLRRPRVVALGIVLQFLLMPLLGFLVAKGLALAPALALGLILVGSCPGGTASNVICYLGRGDVALSVTLTSCTTLLAVAATPALTWAYAGALVPVPVWSMLANITEIVVVPVAAGIVLNRLRPDWTRRLHPLLSLLSVAAIVLIIAIVVAVNRDGIARAAPVVVLAVALHNLSGLAFGYGLARLFGCTARECRTIAIEVGMQNSGLGVALAMKHFSAAAALPAAIFSVWHNLSGSALAALWARGADRGD